MSNRTDVMIEDANGRRIEVVCYLETDERGEGWTTEATGTDVDSVELVWLNDAQESKAVRAAELKIREASVDG